jgi:heme-degrading monooxygenase HmoA
MDKQSNHRYLFYILIIGKNQMSHPSVVLLVKFRSPLSLEEVQAVVDSRIEQFRALPGLVQKYYLQDSETGEYAGLYLWDSAESLAEFRKSDLRQTIAKAYQTEGEPRVEVFQVFDVLRQAGD